MTGVTLAESWYLGALSDGCYSSRRLVVNGSIICYKSFPVSDKPRGTVLIKQTWLHAYPTGMELCIQLTCQCNDYTN